jgi:hypothetical protein
MLTNFFGERATVAVPAPEPLPKTGPYLVTHFSGCQHCRSLRRQLKIFYAVVAACFILALSRLTPNHQPIVISTEDAASVSRARLDDASAQDEVIVVIMEPGDPSR